MSIAQEILNQLRVNIAIYWSWGPSALTDLGKPDGTLGGLQFNVQGAKFKGKVRILLMPSDTYSVIGLNRLGNEKWRFDDIYCEDLQSLIDRQVET